MDLGFPLAQKRVGGGAAPTQEHASKEGVAPIGVTVVRISDAEQGFHPGRRPHPGGTETGGSTHQEHHHRGQLVDEEEHVDHHRKSTQHAKEGPR
jgi:hypothetical protein